MTDCRPSLWVADKWNPNEVIFRDRLSGMVIRRVPSNNGPDKTTTAQRCEELFLLSCQGGLPGTSRYQLAESPLAGAGLSSCPSGELRLSEGSTWCVSPPGSGVLSLGCHSGVAVPAGLVGV